MYVCMYVCMSRGPSVPPPPLPVVMVAHLLPLWLCGREASRFLPPLWLKGIPKDDGPIMIGFNTNGRSSPPSVLVWKRGVTLPPPSVVEGNP